MPTKPDAKRRLSRALEAIPDLTSLSVEAPEFIKWRRSTRLAISNTFGDQSQHLDEFQRLGFDSYSFIVGADYVRSGAVNAYREGMVSATALLESMLEEIAEYWTDEGLQQTHSETQKASVQEVSNRVFVVHGRDLGTKDTVARFLESLDLQPVILQEQPSEGRTLVEKFEDHADVGFAVILCTPDDVGSLASEPEKLRPRPRQNVVLEWGFFYGMLRRNRVCALIQGDVEIPSDYAGVVYIKLDESGGWQMELAREMRKAGLPVDLNRLA